MMTLYKISLALISQQHLTATIWIFGIRGADKLEDSKCPVHINHFYQPKQSTFT